MRAVLRAWIAQAVTWHDPTVLGVALAARDLEGRDWNWLKWLPHVDIPGRLDALGPARNLSTDPDELIALLGPVLADRPAFTGQPTDALRHLLIVVDDPDYDLGASPLAVGRAGVTVVHCSASAPHREQYSIRKSRSCGWLTALSNAGRQAAGSPTSTPPTNSALMRPPTWRADCRGGTPTPPMPGCARRPLAARVSPHCWASRTHPDWMCPRCGRRDDATRSYACRSVSLAPASR